jgi:hypothetical protein
MTGQPAGGMQGTSRHVPTHKVDRTTQAWQELDEPFTRPTFRVAEVFAEWGTSVLSMQLDGIWATTNFSGRDLGFNNSLMQALVVGANGILGVQFATPTTNRKDEQITAKDLPAKVSGLKNMQNGPMFPISGRPLHIRGQQAAVATGGRSVGLKKGVRWMPICMGKISFVSEQPCVATAMGIP